MGETRMSKAEIMEEMVRLAVVDIRAALVGLVETRQQLGDAVCCVYEGYLGAGDSLTKLSEPTVLRAIAALRHALMQAASVVGADKGLVALDLDGDRFVIAER